MELIGRVLRRRHHLSQRPSTQRLVQARLLQRGPTASQRRLRPLITSSSLGIRSRTRLISLLILHFHQLFYVMESLTLDQWVGLLDLKILEQGSAGRSGHPSRLFASIKVSSAGTRCGLDWNRGVASDWPRATQIPKTLALYISALKAVTRRHSAA